MNIYDKLNEAWEKADQYFSQLDVTTSVEVELYAGTAFGIYRNSSIRKWGLATKACNENPKPIRDCNIETRIKCSELLTALYSEVIKSQLRTDTAIAKAITNIETFCKDKT